MVDENGLALGLRLAGEPRLREDSRMDGAAERESERDRPENSRENRIRRRIPVDLIPSI
jgi:hypothetical protein